MSNYCIKDIRPNIELACEANGCPELTCRIKFRFSKRMTRCGGTADSRKQEIAISQYYWDADEEGTNSREQLMFHEVCHLIVDYPWRKKLKDCTANSASNTFHLLIGERPQPHGREWKAAMRQCDVEPKRTHSANMQAPT